ncbi:hypothetical protein, partial [Pseudoscardovia suis]|uniref:hypothetical protein n=1 Tax=Pseudoscardovia suis TaxID=987063 RepID=UPI003F99C266
SSAHPSSTAGTRFSGKSSGDFDNAPGPESPRDTPYGSRDKWQNKTHILSFNPKLAPMRLGGFNVRSKDWTSAERIYGKPCECRGYPQASFAEAQTVHIGLKGVGRARECASMGA